MLKNIMDPLLIRHLSMLNLFLKKIATTKTTLSMIMLQQHEWIIHLNHDFVLLIY